jgi:hypothetical protein
MRSTARINLYPAIIGIRYYRQKVPGCSCSFSQVANHPGLFRMDLQQTQQSALANQSDVFYPAKSERFSYLRTHYATALNTRSMPY